jgi:hypothetical protein
MAFLFLGCGSKQAKDPYLHIQPEKTEKKELNADDSLNIQQRVISCWETAFEGQLKTELHNFEEALLQKKLLNDTTAKGYQQLFMVTWQKRDTVLETLSTIPRQKLSKKAYTDCLLRKYNGVKGKNAHSGLNRVFELYKMFNTSDFNAVKEEYHQKQNQMIEQMDTTMFSNSFVQKMILLDTYFMHNREKSE